MLERNFWLEGDKHVVYQEIFSVGRNYTIDDIPIAIKVVLSTASVERVAILNLLLRKKQSITLAGIAKAQPMSKSTALQAMTALAALKVVNMEDTDVGGNLTKRITLRKEFAWLFSDEFDKLRQGFDPVDSSEYDNIELEQQIRQSMVILAPIQYQTMVSR